MRVAAIPRQLLHCPNFREAFIHIPGAGVPPGSWIGQYDHEFVENRSEFLQLLIFLRFAPNTCRRTTDRDEYQQEFLVFHTEDKTLVCGIPLHISLEYELLPGTIHGVPAEGPEGVFIQISKPVVPDTYLACLSPWVREYLLLVIHDSLVPKVACYNKSYFFLWKNHMVTMEKLYTIETLSGPYVQFISPRKFLELKEKDDIHTAVARRLEGWSLHRYDSRSS